MKIIFFVVTIFLFSGFINAQSKKELKEAGVIYRIETTRKLEKKVMITYNESSEKYDENGNKTEVIEYNSKGDIKTFFQYEYNDKGKVNKEYKIDPISKKTSKTVEYIYEDDNLIKELVYNKKMELVETVVYSYDGKLKLEKKTTNAAGKVIETKTYTYEKKK